MNSQKESLFQTYRSALADCGRFLTFRADEGLWDRLGLPHFLIGLMATWLVGIGRNWDFPEAPLFAKTGLPSVAYIFILSLVLLIMSWPVSYERLNYGKILTLVAMTAPPGLVYAIPVEKMMSFDGAQAANLWFLAIVALWRVALAFYAFKNAGANTGWVTTAILMLPICTIVIGLVVSGRADFVIEIMGGVNRPQNINTGVNQAISALYCLAWPLAALSLFIWIGAIIGPNGRGFRD